MQATIVLTARRWHRSGDCQPNSSSPQGSGDAIRPSVRYARTSDRGIAIDQTGDPLPAETIAACKASSAVLLGAVGGPKWDDPSAKTRPEAGLLRIRKEMQLFANLRPIQTFAELVDASPLKREIVEGTDILFFRELTGGIYFGPSGRETVDGVEQAFATELYSVPEVERIVRLPRRPLAVVVSM